MEFVPHSKLDEELRRPVKKSHNLNDPKNPKDTHDMSSSLSSSMYTDLDTQLMTSLATEISHQLDTRMLFSRANQSTLLNTMSDVPSVSTSQWGEVESLDWTREMLGQTTGMCPFVFEDENDDDDDDDDDY